jgi:hypothetical protein
VLLRIFSYLNHCEILRSALVCKKWHMISQDPRLWVFVSLRPEISGLHVDRVDHLLKLIATKFQNLRYLEISTELITPQVSRTTVPRSFSVNAKCNSLTSYLFISPVTLIPNTYA